MTDELVLVEEPDDEIQPESVALHLPSMIGHAKLASLKKQTLGEQELRLREGQANDALHRLRMAIGLSSVIMVTKIRPAKSQRLKTRAWSEAHNVRKTIVEQARVYTLARNAMKRLLMTDDEADAMDRRFKELEEEKKEAVAKAQQQAKVNMSALMGIFDRSPLASQAKGKQRELPDSSPAQADQPSTFRHFLSTLPPLMRRYRPLVKADLDGATHLVDHTERGASQKELSWIWSVDVGGDAKNSEWLTERKSSASSYPLAPHWQ